MIVDRINAWLLRRLGRMPGRRAVVLAPDGVIWRQGDDELKTTWDRFARVVAFHRPGFVGENITLAFELTDGGVIEVDAEWPGWEALTLALETHLPGARSYTDWMPTLAAGPNERTVTVFTRAPR